MTSIRACKYLALVLLGASALGALLARSPAQLSIPVGGVDIGVRLDALSVVLLAFVSTVVWLVSSYSLTNLVGQQRTQRFGWLLMGATVSLAVLVTGASLPVIAVGWTCSGITLTALVAHTASPGSRRAARYVGHRLLASDLALWSAVVLALIVLPTTNRAGLDLQPPTTGPVIAVTSLMVIAAVLRSGLVPMQGWLAETAEAPSPVSAFLHAGIVNGAGILGALMWPLFAASPLVLGSLLAIGLATVAAGTWSARVRGDIKGQLAGSTTAQMGYMAIQLGAGLPAAAVLHLIGHGYYKAWLFLRAGGAVTRARQRSPHNPSPAPMLSSSRAGATLAAAVAAAALLSAPAVITSARSLGLTAVLPTALALTAVAVATRAVTRSPRVSWTTAAVVTATAITAAAAYSWFLLGWEHLLSTPLPLDAVWGPAAGVVILGAVLAGFALIAHAARRLRTDPASVLAVHLSATVLPPNSRHWPPPRSHQHPRTPAPDVQLDAHAVSCLVDAAAATSAPAWPLRTFVAANPLAGLERFDFHDASAIAAACRGARTYLPLPDYAARYARGEISDSALRAALTAHAPGPRTSHHTSTTAAIDQLIARASAPRTADFADASRSTASTADVEAGTAANPGAGPTIATDHAHLWCQRAWASADDEHGPGPWTVWRGAAATGAYDAVVRRRGASAAVGDLPGDPSAALGVLLENSGLRRDELFAYVTGLVHSGPGWSAHAAWRDRRSGTHQAMTELIALRCALDILINAQPTVRGAGTAMRPHARTATGAREVADEAVWQAALEATYHDQLVHELADRARQGPRPTRRLAPARAQFVFCIDVRSGPIREEIERDSPWYQTYGFAGFFGAAIRYEPAPGVHFDQCPVIIEPTRVIRECPPVVRARDLARQVLAAVSGAPLTGFVVAEFGGLASGVAAAWQTLSPRTWQQQATAAGAHGPRWGRQDLAGSTQDPTAHAPGHLPGYTRQAQVDLAAGALAAIGLVDHFAPFLIICGHASTTENNAFASGYDCGACGGNSGAVNARVLAEAINDPHVRIDLAARGIIIPSRTIAVAAIHDTSTDVIHIDPDIDPEPLLNTITADLARASDRVRARRAPTLPSAGRGITGTALRRSYTRATHWAQPFPEWGLAGNAALVIGPRSLTRGLNLHGRVFLHSYTAEQDPDNAILDVLLTAPAVVAHWISSQYYFSTVDPTRFGAGDKTTHNVIGDIGVLTGAHGDLRTGLPWQAIYPHDPTAPGSEPLHPPLRIMIIVRASPAAIRDVLANHPAVAQIFTNSWAHLVAIDPATGTPTRLTTDLQWSSTDVPSGLTIE